MIAGCKVPLRCIRCGRRFDLWLSWGIFVRRDGGREGEGYLSLKAQNCWFITCQTISSDAIVLWWWLEAVENNGERVDLSFQSCWEVAE